jgi:AraC-like DNA-binding protein
MDILNITPLLSTVLGFLLTFFILFRKAGLGQDKNNRFILSGLVYIYTLTCLDSYLEINGVDTRFQGYSYLLFHFTGYLFLYFIVKFTKYELNNKRWIAILIIHTLLKWIILSPMAIYEENDPFYYSKWITFYFEVVELEYLFSALMNIGLTGFTFYILSKKKLVLDLDQNQKTHYKWLKFVLLVSIVIQFIGIINSIFNATNIDNLDFYLKLDTLITAIFFFVFAYSVIHFPVFVFTGNFEDLPEQTKQKYAKSSLHDSTDLFNEIESLVKSEKLYLEIDLKLNNLAEKLDKSVHHISQAINQKAEMSFPDYINQFRIEEAKLKLLEPKPDTIYTISLDVGFNSKAAFYNAFKKFTGMTPTQFKKENKGA